MKIAQNTVVSMHYTVKNDQGETIDSSVGKNPLLYLHGFRNIIPGLESALEGKSAGETVEASIEPAQAYGEILDELVQEVPISAFDGVENLEIGMRFTAQSDEGQVAVMVTKIDGEMITVDGNHALAGQRLHFNVTVEEVREASAEELQHGHAHGAGGHHH